MDSPTLENLSALDRVYCINPVQASTVSYYDQLRDRSIVRNKIEL